MGEERRLRDWRPAVKGPLRNLLLVSSPSRRSRMEGLTLRQAGGGVGEASRRQNGGLEVPLSESAPRKP